MAHVYSARSVRLLHFYLTVPETMCQMIVDDSDPLHMCIYCRTSQKFESPFLQILADGVGEFGSYGNILAIREMILDWFAIRKRPDI